MQGVVRLPHEQVKRIHCWSGRRSCARCPSWKLPLVAGTLFAVLTTLWLTSAYWYFTEVRFGL